MTGRHHERGSGSLLTIITVLMLSVLVWVGLAAVGALARSHQAQHAADLTALAAAGAYSEGQEPCREAQKAAALNRAQLESCELLTEGTAFVVTVEVGMPLRILGQEQPLVRHATAGSQ